MHSLYLSHTWTLICVHRWGWIPDLLKQPESQYRIYKMSRLASWWQWEILNNKENQLTHLHPLGSIGPTGIFFGQVCLLFCLTTIQPEPFNPRKKPSLIATVQVQQWKFTIWTKNHAPTTRTERSTQKKIEKEHPISNASPVMFTGCYLLHCIGLIHSRRTTIKCLIQRPYSKSGFGVATMQVQSNKHEQWITQEKYVIIGWA